MKTIEKQFIEFQIRRLKRKSRNINLNVRPEKEDENTELWKKISNLETKIK